MAQETAAEKLKRLVATKLNTPLEKPVEITQELVYEPEQVNTDHKHLTYNAEQNAFIQAVLAGEDVVLIGAAGTGKTTAVGGLVALLLSLGILGTMEANTGHNYISTHMYNILFVSYIRKVVNNLKQKLPKDLQRNAISMHKALEYQPCFEEIEDKTTGLMRKVKIFRATRSNYKKIDNNIQIVIIDEASTVDTQLFKQFKAALPCKCQFVFLGDINQLQPIFGAPILGYKLLDIQVIELKQVYRQALESPIINLAHRILSGVPLTQTDLDTYSVANNQGSVSIKPYKKVLSEEECVKSVAAYMAQEYIADRYSPLNDMILIPFNKSCGTIELNNHIANFLAEREGRIVHEIINGFNTNYYSVGDKVMYDKEEAIIVCITPNKLHLGKKPQCESATLDYWGYNRNPIASEEQYILEDIESIDSIDELLAAVNISVDKGETKLTVSHYIEVQFTDSAETYIIRNTSDMNKLFLAYAITIHKAIGSEWNNVYCVFHRSHATMLTRELLYTAVTRAKYNLTVICEKDTFVKGIVKQKIVGNTLAEKIEHFRKTNAQYEAEISVANSGFND